jgi:hypothetical protein
MDCEEFKFCAIFPTEKENFKVNFPVISTDCDHCTHFSFTVGDFIGIWNIQCVLQESDNPIGKHCGLDCYRFDPNYKTIWR